MATKKSNKSTEQALADAQREFEEKARAARSRRASATKIPRAPGESKAINLPHTGDKPEVINLPHTGDKPKAINLPQRVGAINSTRPDAAWRKAEEIFRSGKADIRTRTNKTTGETKVFKPTPITAEEFKSKKRETLTKSALKGFDSAW